MRLKTLHAGVILLKIFVISLIADMGLLTAFLLIREKNYIIWGISAGSVILIEGAVFWTGIILTYSTSVQLGIRTRVLGIVLGWIPVAHLIMLIKIIKVCSAEVRFEKFVMKRDAERSCERICQTKYPLLMVAVVFYGEHGSAASVSESSEELGKKVKEIIEETGCEKVNIIAHSKGGLDARAMIRANPSLVASLTTVNTPHRGCEFAEYFFNRIPESARLSLAKKYNYAAARLGDRDPDFISAVRDLTSSACAQFNQNCPDNPDVYYQSVGSVLHKAVSGRFPLNCTYHLVKYFDGENDGLVGSQSFPWGENTVFLRNEKGSRGISHGDVIDLNRENIEGFDVREFYVQLVSDLRKKGM